MPLTKSRQLREPSCTVMGSYDVFMDCDRGIDGLHVIGSIVLVAE